MEILFSLLKRNARKELGDKRRAWKRRSTGGEEEEEKEERQQRERMEGDVSIACFLPLPPSPVLSEGGGEAEKSAAGRTSPERFRGSAQDELIISDRGGDKQTLLERRMYRAMYR